MVEFDLRVGTSAGVGRIAKIATRAGVHGSNKHKVCWIGSFATSTRDGDPAILQRLTEGFQNGARIFWELVKKEYTRACERDFSWLSFGPATD